MTARAITFAFGLALAAAAGCSGVDKDDNNNQGNSNQNQNNNTAAGTGTLTGEISTTVTCDATDEDLDCDGTLYVVLLAENPLVNPMQSPEAFEVIPNVDLDGNTVTYTMNNVPVGDWYVSGFLDDDGSTSPALPAPGADDPVGYPAPQVTIVADQTTTENIIFMTRLP